MSWSTASGSRSHGRLAAAFLGVDLSSVRAYLDQTLISHLITSSYLAPLVVEAPCGLIVEVIDGQFSGYLGHILHDLVKASLARLAYGMAMELVGTDVTALALSPGFLRSEAVLEHFGVQEDNWRDAIEKDPYFAQSETPRLVGRAAAALAADRTWAHLRWNTASRTPTGAWPISPGCSTRR